MDDPTNDWFLKLFDPDDERRAEQLYRRLQEKLVSYFAWRKFPDAEDLASEVISRAVASLSKGTVLNNPDPTLFCFGIARMLLLEALRERKKRTQEDSLDNQPEPSVSSDSIVDGIYLREALARLSEDERTLLTAYHTEDRKRLARKLGVSDANLRVKICQLRKRIREWRDRDEPKSGPNKPSSGDT